MAVQIDPLRSSDLSSASGRHALGGTMAGYSSCLPVPWSDCDLRTHGPDRTNERRGRAVISVCFNRGDSNQE